MKAKSSFLVFFVASLLLSGNWLSAQEYLNLWRNPNTDNFYLIQQKFNEYFVNRDKGRGTGYKQFKRWEEFMEPRVYPSGKLVNPARLALDEELRYQGRTGNTMRRGSHTGNWTSLGIKNYTGGKHGGIGRVNCIVPHPTDPQTLFIGTPTGGIWKTTDGGSNWIPLSDGIPVLGVSGIAINPVYPDSIYILTGDGDGGHTFSLGVLLSTNGGDTWQSTGLQWDIYDRRRGFKLLMHPTDRRILFAVTTSSVYVSKDAGVSWDATLREGCYDLAFKPNDPSTLYAVTSTQFFISHDTGQNWDEPVGTGLPLGSESNSNRIAIGVTSANPEYIYLLYGAHSSAPTPGFIGLYRSVNGGGSFELRSSSPNILGGEVQAPFDSRSQSFFDLAIAVPPDNAEEVHIGGINNWKSSDGGTTWNYTSDWKGVVVSPGQYTHADIHALVFIDNTLYCGSDGGVYVSKDHATSWYNMSEGLEITQFYRIGTPADNLNIVYGGAQDNGINKWVAPNTTMEHLKDGDVMECVVDYTDGNIVYAFIYLGGILYVTRNGGGSWVEYLRPPVTSAEWVVPLVMDPSDHTTLYAGYDAVYKITSGWLGGMTFTPVSPVFERPCVSLAMSISNSNLLYAATKSSLKLCSTINTSYTAPSDWMDITDGLPIGEAEITSVMVSAVEDKKAWVCFSGYSNGKKVYQTSDGGATWVNFSGTLPNVPVNCITYHNNGKDGVYIGTDIGVFYRDNTMIDWMPFRNGMPNVIVYDLEITNDRIRAATFGRGIWESDLYDNCTNDFLILSGDVTGYQFFETGDGIESSVNIKGGIGTKVQYKAANIISLETGFRVAPQSGFVASIGDCNNSTSDRQSRSVRRYRGVYEGVMPGVLGIASIADSTLLSLPANRLKVYPNPFSRQSTIEFYIPKQTPVTISLWNLSGKRIKVLFESKNQSAGNYQVRLESAGLSAGVYFVRLQTQDYQETKKIVITQ